MSPEQIFQKALALGNNAYQKQSRLKWGLSICATPIQLGQGIILGINWGGGGTRDHYAYESQKNMPTLDEFQDDLKNGSYRFLTRSKGYLTKYLGVDVTTGKFNYTNLCLFRSPSQKDLQTEDYASCFETFKFLVREISPPWVISFGITNIEKLKEIDSTFTPQAKIFGKAKAWKATFLNTPFYCVPHPNAHLSKKDRDGIWKAIFSG